MISIKHAHCAYGDFKVLEDISFDVTKGEIICLMGPNGCGKSTLIDYLLGRKYLDQGDIILDGKNIREYSVRELAQKISYIPQHHEQVFDYTVEQVVLMGCSPKNKLSVISSPKEEDMNIVKEALECTNILHLAKRPYTKLSGGEIQLVLLARALAQNTPILILDEPCAYLDLHNELLFLETVMDLVKRQNKTVIMATHSPNHGFYFDNHQILTRVALLHQRELYALGAPSKVLSAESLETVYRIKAKVIEDKENQFHQVITLATAERSSYED